MTRSMRHTARSPQSVSQRGFVIRESRNSQFSMLNSAFIPPLSSFPLFLVSILLTLSSLGANIVINELMYDPDGTDTGHEWIELYNNGTYDIDLEGARILKAGSAFTEVFVFPRFILRSGRWLLLGEAQVPNAQFTADLAFQNGGSETDAVRFESADGTYSDTVLYDTPNKFDLSDDTGSVAVSFAADVPQGLSLARVINGWDTDDCSSDWVAESTPTPGVSNPVRIDYGLYWPSLRQDDGDWICGVWVKNLSPLSVPLEAPLEFRLDGFSVGSVCACNIDAGDSLYFENWLAINDDANHQIEIVLDLPSDPNQANNYISMQLFTHTLQPPVINELMYRPASGYQEWVEIWQKTASRGAYRLEDRAGNGFDFELPERAGYFVLCNSVGQLLSRYPDCPAQDVILVNAWASLNNDGDELWLFDSSGAVIDSMTYAEDATPPDRSLERYESQGMRLWRACLASAGATPGSSNSTPVAVPPDQNSPVAVYGSPCKAIAGEQIRVSYQLPDAQNRVSCQVWSRAGHLIRILADNTLLPNTGILSWDGRDQGGRYVPRGLYYISWSSRGLSSGKELNRRFSVAIRD